MTALERFLDPLVVSLKICGITRERDAAELVASGVDALGVNFWPGSKRYHAPEDAAWLKQYAGRILRVGVFVNAPAALPLRLYRDGLLDVIQLHGDETPVAAAPFRDAGVPFVKAIGVRTMDELDRADEYRAAALLLDAHAPGVFGGTGKGFDWNVALEFRKRYPGLPLILAGGIVPENARAAITAVKPAALDVASGAETTPGVKDFAKVRALLAAVARQ